MWTIVGIPWGLKALGPLTPLHNIMWQRWTTQCFRPHLPQRQQWQALTRSKSGTALKSALTLQCFYERGLQVPNCLTVYFFLLVSLAAVTQLSLRLCACKPNNHCLYDKQNTKICDDGHSFRKHYDNGPWLLVGFVEPSSSCVWGQLYGKLVPQPDSWRISYVIQKGVTFPQ